MRAKLLYTYLLAGVLALSACGGPEAPAGTGQQPNPTEAQQQMEPDNPGPAGIRSHADSAGEMTMDEHIRLVFLGNSITAGFGVDTDQAFPALVQNEIDQADLPVTVVNAGFSGDTSTGGLNRIDWLLQRNIDVLVIELGGNDGLRGIDLSLTESNLNGIIERTLERYPDCRIVVAGMMVPPNLGHKYSEDFRKIFPALAERYAADLIPFILEGVGGIRELNQPDGIHPTPEGHRIVAQTVWTLLEPILSELARSDRA